MFWSVVDYSLAIAQSVLALLLWHRAEPRMRQARGVLRAWCVIFLGFVLAWSFPLALVRPLLDDPDNWQRSMRDFALLCTALCFYRHAMKLKPKELSGA